MALYDEISELNEIIKKDYISDEFCDVADYVKLIFQNEYGIGHLLDSVYAKTLVKKEYDCAFDKLDIRESDRFIPSLCGSQKFTTDESLIENKKYANSIENVNKCLTLTNVGNNQVRMFFDKKMIDNLSSEEVYLLFTQNVKQDGNNDNFIAKIESVIFTLESYKKSSNILKILAHLKDYCNSLKNGDSSFQLKKSNSTTIDNSIFHTKHICNLTKNGDSFFPLKDNSNMLKSSGSFFQPHHSEIYKANHFASYRVIGKFGAIFVPLLLTVKRFIESLNSGGECLILIDGYCCGGKTALASFLQTFLCANVFHMDDYYLPFERRLGERFAFNIDFEKIGKLLKKIKNQQEIIETKFNCASGKYLDLDSCSPKKINIIEGTYSHMIDCSDMDPKSTLKLFCDMSETEQEKRLLAKIPPQLLPNYRAVWLKKEKEYFEFIGMRLDYYNNQADK